LRPETASRRLDLLDGRARALVAAGRLADSRAALLDAIALAMAAAPERRVAFEIACARVEQWEGRARDARRRLLAARETVRGAGTADAAHLALLLAVDGLHELDFRVTRALGAEALGAAGAAGDGALGAEALAVLAAGDAADGRLNAARAHADQAAVLLDALDDAALGPHVEGVPLPRLGRDDARALRARAAPRRARARGLAGDGQAHAPWSRSSSAASSPTSASASSPAPAMPPRRPSRPCACRVRAQELTWALWTRAYAEIHTGDVHDAVRLAGEAVEAARGLEANVLSGADRGGRSARRSSRPARRPGASRSCSRPSAAPRRRASRRSTGRSPGSAWRTRRSSSATSPPPGPTPSAPGAPRTCSTGSRRRRAPRPARSRRCSSPRAGRRMRLPCSRPALDETARGAAALEVPRLRLALGRALEAADGRRRAAVETLVAAEQDLARPRRRALARPGRA